MDTSFWTKLSPNIIREATTKQYFGRYLHKLVLEVPGGRAINVKGNESIAIYLQERMATQRTYNYAGSWGNYKLNELHQAVPDQLDALRDIKDRYRNDVKFRVEEPWMQIYAETEDMLKVIAASFEPDLQKKIRIVGSPAAGTENLLREGKILVNGNKTPYKYKILMRDGTYPIDIKTRVLEYLTNDEVGCKVSKGTERMFTNNSTYIWGCFFYTNDLRVITFLKLLCPDLVGKIHELEYIGQ